MLPYLLLLLAALVALCALGARADLSLNGEAASDEHFVAESDAERRLRAVPSGRPSFTKVDGPEDCRPIQGTNAYECSVKAAKCSRYNIFMSFFSASCPQLPGFSGCQCANPNRCLLVKQGGYTMGMPCPPVTHAPTPSPSCFPSRSKVQLSSGQTKSMDQVTMGDLVQVVDLRSGALAYEPVSAFLHVNRTGNHSYLHISTEHGNAIELSHNHVVFMSTSALTPPTDVMAMRVVVGQYLWVVRDDVLVPSKVVSKLELEAPGLFAPFTAAWTIVVDGVMASVMAYDQDLHAGHTVSASILQLLFPVLTWLGHFPSLKSGELPMDHDALGAIAEGSKTMTIAFQRYYHGLLDGVAS
jgi:hypothetical protein